MYQGVILHSSDVSEWFSNLGEKNAKADEPPANMKDSWEHTKTDI